MDSCARLPINVLELLRSDERIRDDGDKRGWARAGRRISSDEGGQHVGDVLSTAVSREKGRSAGGKIGEADGGVGGSEQEHALGES